MSIGKRKHTDDLTDEEIAFLRSERAPDAVRQFLSRQHESIGVRTSAYRKVAAAANAERDAIMAVAHVGLARAVIARSAGETDRVAALESERRQLLGEMEAMRERLLAATALPALAVHSGPTR